MKFIILVPLALFIIVLLTLNLYDYINTLGEKRAYQRKKENSLYFENLYNSFDLITINEICLMYDILDVDKDFLMKYCKKEIKDSHWFEKTKYPEAPNHKEYRNKLFCCKVCDILKNRDKIIEYLNKNDKNFTFRMQNTTRSSGSLFENIDDSYIYIKGSFYDIELVFYLLVVNDLKIKELNKYYKMDYRPSLVHCIAPIIDKEISLYKIQSLTNDFDEAFEIFKSKRDYKLSNTIIKNILYLNTISKDRRNYKVNKQCKKTLKTNILFEEFLKISETIKYIEN